MTMKLTRPLLAILPLLLAACDSSPPPVADDAGDAGDAPPDVAEIADVTGIPQALRGSWGMSEADCDPDRFDAKGLIEIDAGTLRYYESVGTLDTVIEHSPTRLRANFDFSGEGMEWRNEITLDLDEETGVMTETQVGEDAWAGAFVRRRCN